MSRRNPTPAQRREINKLMEKGLTYEQARMSIPESAPDPRCGLNGNKDPELTNKPKGNRKRDMNWHTK